MKSSLLLTAKAPILVFDCADPTHQPSLDQRQYCHHNQQRATCRKLRLGNTLWRLTCARTNSTCPSKVELTTTTSRTEFLGGRFFSDSPQKLFYYARTLTQTSSTTRSATTTSATRTITTTRVNCQFSDWSSWGKCNRPCNGGNQTRTRSVAVPEVNGGTPCVGDEEEMLECNAQTCAQCVPGRCEGRNSQKGGVGKNSWM